MSYFLTTVSNWSPLVANWKVTVYLSIFEDRCHGIALTKKPCVNTSVIARLLPTSKSKYMFSVDTNDLLTLHRALNFWGSVKISEIIDGTTYLFISSINEMLIEPVFIPLSRVWRYSGCGLCVDNIRLIATFAIFTVFSTLLMLWRDNHVVYASDMQVVAFNCCNLHNNRTLISALHNEGMRLYKYSNINSLK